MHRQLRRLYKSGCFVDCSSKASRPLSSSKSKIWWSNGLFFVAIHLLAMVGVYFWPPKAVPRQTLALAFILWQAGCFGVTIGYHRLYSHRTFKAGLWVRIVLATLGSSAFQGSIKWWSLRHRLHHRFTDDPVHDPYSASRGLLFSHMGWIFFKPRYERMESIDRDDLESDSVVRFQHRYYIPLAIFSGLVVPTLFGYCWNDTIGALIWGGFVTRVAIWHCTFLVNSLAHWKGLQPYTDENSSRSNLVFALLTCGEGNHNFHHAFPHDFRSGPSVFDWDPSKWIILSLSQLGLVTHLRRAPDADVRNSKAWMDHKHHGADYYSSRPINYTWDGDTWNEDQIRDYISDKKGACILMIDGFFVDATEYIEKHPGGATLLRRLSIRFNTRDDGTDFVELQDASSAFNGGMNNHSSVARRLMRELRVAQVL